MTRFSIHRRDDAETGDRIASVDIPAAVVAALIGLLVAVVVVLLVAVMARLAAPAQPGALRVRIAVLSGDGTSPTPPAVSPSAWSPAEPTAADAVQGDEGQPTSTSVPPGGCTGVGWSYWSCHFRNQADALGGAT